MTSRSGRTSLFVRRLVVTRRGRRVYDQSFHNGINIIRGSNSSGKSTIADFFFYSLGGDVSSWKPEASLCDEVLVDVELSGARATLARTISEHAHQPMRVFWGSLERASTAPPTEWEIFSFQRSERKESFSQVILAALGVPEVRQDAGSMLTLHQLFRLIYVDQLTPVDSLMRTEQFDSSLAREAVRDLLFGVYDETLYDDEADLRATRAQLESVGREYKTTLSILEAAGQGVDKVPIGQQQAKVDGQLEALETAIASVRQETREPKDTHHTRITQRQNELLLARTLVGELQKEITGLEYEIEDSQVFLRGLDSRLNALDESQGTRAALRGLPATVCPQCLRPLRQHESDTACLVCGQDDGMSPDGSQIARHRQELRFQRDESRVLLNQREAELMRSRTALPEARAAVTSANRRFRSSIKNVERERDARVDELLVKKGALEQQLETLDKQLKVAALLDELRATIARLQVRVEKLRASVEDRRRRQASRLDGVATAVATAVKSILSLDLPAEEAFEKPHKVEMLFNKNTFALDGRNQFSASSITLLKNAFHFAILRASLEVDYMRYPRLVICDNIEDKGMEEARSQNFQRAILKLFGATKVDYQIIFTTSMIAPELDVDDYVVGPKYSRQRKTLDMSSFD